MKCWILTCTENLLTTRHPHIWCIPTSNIGHCANSVAFYFAVFDYLRIPRVFPKAHINIRKLRQKTRKPTLDTTRSIWNQLRYRSRRLPSREFDRLPRNFFSFFQCRPHRKTHSFVVGGIEATASNRRACWSKYRSPKGHLPHVISSLRTLLGLVNLSAVNASLYWNASPGVAK